jgi:MFS family permease
MRQRSGARLSTDYWKLWWAATISNLGDGIRLTALPLLMAAITRDPLIVAGATTATTLPWILFSLPAGALVDRWDRKRIMVVGQLARGIAVALLTLAIVTGSEAVWLVYAVGFIIGLGEVFVDSSSQAAIPLLAGDAELEKANSNLLAVEFITNEAVGGPLGAFLFAAMAAIPFGVDSASFLLAALLVSRIRIPLQTAHEEARVSMRSSIVEGLRFVWDNRLLRGLALAVSAANFALGGGGALLVLLALDVLGASEVGYGLMIGFGALGGLVGALSASWLSAVLGRRWAMTGGALVLAVGQLGLGLAPNIAVGVAGLFIGTFGVSVFSVVGRSLRQAVSPDRILGRVVTSFRLIGFGALPLGAALAGVLAAATSVRVPYLAGSLIVAIAGFGIYRVSTDERLQQAADLKSPPRT